MNKFKPFIILNLLLLLASCGTVKEGFTNQKKNSNDEFLVEKKSPLVIPPNYNELPEPNTNKNKNNSDKSEIKKLITNKKIEETSGDTKDINETFEESLLEKIKNN